MSDYFDLDGFFPEADVTSAPAVDPAQFSADVAQASADAFFTYRPSVVQHFSSMLDSKNILENPLFGGTTPEGVKLEGKPVSTGDGIMDSIRKFMGYPDTPAGRIAAGNAAVGAAVTAGGAVLAGIGQGINSDRARKLAEKKLETENRVADSQIALNNSKAHQNLSTLTVGAPGLINFTPAKFVPVKQRSVTA